MTPCNIENTKRLSAVLPEVMRRTVVWIVLFAASISSAMCAGQSAAGVQPGTSIRPASVPCAVKQEGDNRVRSVVLRHVMGQVGMDRGHGRGIELARRNSPVVEGARLVTAEGYAEVTFEDLTHVRLTPATVVVFEQLSRRRMGDRLSVIALNLGTIYIDTPNIKGSGIRLHVGPTCISVDRGTHLRMEISEKKAALSVFFGNATVEAPGGHTVTLTRNQSLPFHVAAKDMTKAITGIEERPYDDWEAKAIRRYQPYLRAPPSVWP